MALPVNMGLFYRASRSRLRCIATLSLFSAGIFIISRYTSMDDSQGSLRQKEVKDKAKYFSENLRITMKVLKNTQNEGGYHVREVTLTNVGDITFPGDGWEIYFSQIYPPQQGILGRPKDDYGVVLHHIQGQMYKFTPLPNFRPIEAGWLKSFTYRSGGASLAFTDSFPNWYLIIKGSAPHIITNTIKLENFVKIDESPATWKAHQDEESSEFDKHNPPTSGDRYERESVPNLGYAPLPVIPTPLSKEDYMRTERLNMHLHTWIIAGDSLFKKEMTFLSDAWNLAVSSSVTATNCIQFEKKHIHLTSPSGQKYPDDEAYSLEVSPSASSIKIAASTKTGAFYAVQSLLALRDNAGNVPSIAIQDAPRFQYRGVMLDLARNFISKDKIKRVIRAMAMYKLNKLHFHLSDDEGWRIEIPGLAELTQIGGKRCHDVKEKKCLLPFLGSGPFADSIGSGFLSVSDYKEVLKYAVDHHIEVIPEVDVPGHAHAAIVAMKQRYLRTGSNKYLLSDMNDRSSYQSVQGFTDNAINPCINSTYLFLEKVISEIQHMHQDISPLSRFHFGGDEVPGSAWQNSPSCEALKAENLQTYFLSRLSQILTSLGLDIAAWEDGFKAPGGANLPRSTFKQRHVYSYSWKNPPHLQELKSAYTMANMGYKVVLASATNLYLDHPQEPDPAERGLVWATRYLNTRRAYSYSPLNLYASTNVDIRGHDVPFCEKDAFLCPNLEQPQNIEGMEAVLFGELITSTPILDYMLFPRLLAIAERAWHEAEWEDESPLGKSRKALQQQDWVDFANTLGHRELPRLENLGYHFRIDPPGATLVEGRGSPMLVVNTTFPGCCQVEMSRNNGWGWSLVPDEGTRVDVNEHILLRAKSGVRTSRSIPFNPKRRFMLDD